MSNKRTWNRIQVLSTQCRLSVKSTTSRVAHETSNLRKTSKTFRKSNCSIVHPEVRYQSHSILNHWTDDGQNFDVLFCLTSPNRWKRAFITLTHSIIDGIRLGSSFIRFSDEIHLQITRRFSKTHHPILNISSFSVWNHSSSFSALVSSSQIRLDSIFCSESESWSITPSESVYAPMNLSFEFSMIENPSQRLSV